ncbi:hypothetical protein H0H93_015178 [Arthromyces matolae]|nr:hypothetical protein H0H93_015178 [Arthromyces matolae]
MSTDFDMQRLDEKLGQFQSHISLVTSPSEWLSANIDNICLAWEETLSLSKDELVDVKRFLYPRLFTYTFARLKGCADAKLLLDFQTNISLCIHFDDVTLLRHYRSLKETLWAFLNRARAHSKGHPATNTTGENINKLLRLDVLSLAARILALVSDGRRKKAFLNQRDSDAQTLLDLLQHILDLPELEIVRPSILRILLELSKRSGLCPTSLILQGVEPRGTESVTAGSFGDIWQGTFAGNAVAIKVMRIDSTYTDKGLKIIDVAQGLNYLHNFDPPVIHGDLRGTNILVTPDKRASIADFGLCTLAGVSLLQFTPTSTAFQCTNLLWLAPEFFQFEENGNETPRQSLATDIYSYACVCFEVRIHLEYKFDDGLQLTLR